MKKILIALLLLSFNANASNVKTLQTGAGICLSSNDLNLFSTYIVEGNMLGIEQLFNVKCLMFTKDKGVEVLRSGIGPFTNQSQVRILGSQFKGWVYKVHLD